jgi:hypothetical protein
VNCKNCQNQISESYGYCPTCGGKVIHDRITTRNIWNEVSDKYLGWDNKYLVTLKLLLTRPQIIFKEYLSGARKKYLNPFTFLAIGLAITLFLFNLFSEDFMEISVEANKRQLEFYGEKFGGFMASEEYQAEQLEQTKNVNGFMLKYFNILTFVLLPFYTLLAYWVFRKPYNYGEHFAINTYILGITFLGTSLFFVLSVVVHPILYFLTMVFTLSYYSYAYKKLYKLTFAEILLKILKFIGLLLLIILVLGAILFVFGIIHAFLTK